MKGRDATLLETNDSKMSNSFNKVVNTISVSSIYSTTKAFRHILKVGPSSSKKNYFIFFNESPLKMMKNAFYFTLKTLFVLKIFKVLPSTFGQNRYD